MGKSYPTEWVYYATQDKQTFEEYKGHWPSLMVKTVIAPNKRTAETFAEKVDILLKEVSSNIRENETLAQTRDVLLPKLMSGEIRLRGAERALGAVL